MSAKHSGLGMGLSGLLGIKDLNSYEKNGILEIGINKIIANPNQPRKTFDTEEIIALSNSIKQYGILQPIIVKSLNDGMYQIIAGERRFRACKYANLEKVKCIINDIDEIKSFEIAMIENIQRENLNIIEEANGYNFLQQSCNLTQLEIANKVGKSRSHVSNLIRISELSEKCKSLILSENISLGHIKVALSKDNPEKLLQNAVDNKLTVRELESLASKSTLKPSKTQNKNNSFTSSDFLEKLSLISQEMSKLFNINVKFEQNDQANDSDVIIKYSDPIKLEKMFKIIS